jgi:hypothetical protein
VNDIFPPVQLRDVNALGFKISEVLQTASNRVGVKNRLSVSRDDGFSISLDVLFKSGNITSKIQLAQVWKSAHACS